MTDVVRWSDIKDIHESWYPDFWLEDDAQEEIDRKFDEWNEVKNVWVDPPSGWRYGFPKVWDRVDPLHDWLVKNGYPGWEIAACAEYFQVRMWNVS